MKLLTALRGCTTLFSAKSRIPGGIVEICCVLFILAAQS
jgi:hypothetical protein